MKKLTISPVAAISAIVCLSVAVVGMGGYIYSHVRGEITLREGMVELYRAELEGNLTHLQSDIADLSPIYAYHHAKSAADCAVKCGQRATAEALYGIADKIAAEGITDSLADALLQLDTPEPAQLRTLPAEDVTILEHSAARRMYSEAHDSAARLMGTGIELSQDLISRNGVIVFACDNAYALIDSNLIPVEFATSQSPDEPITEEESIILAKTFLGNYFSRDSVKEAVFLGLSPVSDGSPVLSIGYELDGHNMTVLVNRSTGRIVGYRMEK